MGVLIFCLLLNSVLMRDKCGMGMLWLIDNPVLSVGFDRNKG